LATTRERIKSGIPGLDALLGGGFLEGSINTISGDAGTGKTVFGVQFLVNGAVKYGEPGMYISFDEHKQTLFQNMLTFGWDLEKLEREKQMVTIQYPPYEIDQFASQEGVIHDLIDKLEVQRLVIDPITPVALLYESEHERRQGLLKIIERLRNWGCTTLMMSEAVGEITPRAKYGIDFLSDSLLHLYYNKTKTGRERAVEVIKMRGSAHESRVVPFRITSKGIVVGAGSGEA